jgi:hypothetical protein
LGNDIGSPSPRKPFDVAAALLESGVVPEAIPFREMIVERLA